MFQKRNCPIGEVMPKEYPKGSSVVARFTDNPFPREPKNLTKLQKKIREIRSKAYMEFQRTGDWRVMRRAETEIDALEDS